MIVEEPTLMRTLISWVPMLIYIAMMVIFIRKMGQVAKGVERIANALDEQTDLNK